MERVCLTATNMFLKTAGFSVLPMKMPCESCSELDWCAAAAQGVVQVAAVTAALPCIVPAAVLCDFLAIIAMQ